MSDFSELELQERREQEAEDRAFEALNSYLCTEVEEFNKVSIRTIKRLLARILVARAEFAVEAESGEKKHADAFYTVIDKLFERFYEVVRLTVLPEPLPDWWFYTFEVRTSGIKLLLNHYDWEAKSEKEYECSRSLSVIALREVPARLLTVGEYAEKFGVEQGTVRQWIRRAKIRSAVRYGREWLIPELAEVKRAQYYTPCEYYWSSELTDLPEEYDFLKHFCNLYFTQDRYSRKQYKLSLYSEGEHWALFDSEDSIERRKQVLQQYPSLRLSEQAEVLLTGAKREKMEMYLIGNPLVQIRDNTNGVCRFPSTDVIAEFGADYCGISLSVELKE